MNVTVALAAVGAASGAVNGLFGTGGGTVMVLAMLWLCRDLGEREVFANVCASILPMSVASALTYSGYSPPDMGVALTVGSAALGGGILGAFLLGKIKPTVLKLIFSAVMAVSGAVMIGKR